MRNKANDIILITHNRKIDLYTCLPGLSKSKPSPHMWIPLKYFVANGCLSSQHITVSSQPPDISSWCDFGLKAHANTRETCPSVVSFVGLKIIVTYAASQYKA